MLPWTIAGQAEVELAFLIDRTRWGEELATEASFGIIQYARDVVDLRRLICVIVRGNERSAAVARKVGMQFEMEHVAENCLCHIYARSI